MGCQQQNTAEDKIMQREQTKCVNTRLPLSLIKKLRAAAARDRRTMSSYIYALIDKDLASSTERQSK